MSNKPPPNAVTLTQPDLRADRGSDKRVVTLSIAHHPEAAHVGRRVTLKRGGSVSLGRPCDRFGPGVLNLGHVSRNHAQVSVTPGGAVQVMDVGSRNGTFLNGEPVGAAPVQEGDVIGVGPVLLLMHRAPAVYTPRRSATLIGSGPAMSAVLEEIDLVAPHPTSVLICGETGTGKELAAQALHQASGRRGPFLAINCGGLTETLLQSELFGHVRGAFSGAGEDRAGLIESADGGTLFLDEIGDAPPALQVALLRFLEVGEVRRIGAREARRVDTRVVAATHRDLEAAAAAGDYREDLYARLSRWVLRLPPLRERPEDIGPLAAHFVSRHGGEARALHPELALQLLRYPWPRNVRELALVVERAVIESRGETPIPLTPGVRRLLTPPAVAPVEAKPAIAPRPSPEALRALLAENRGNVKALASELGYSRQALYNWIREAGIDLGPLRTGAAE